MSRLRIEVTSGTDRGAIFEPDGDIVRIGRSPSNDIYVRETHISGAHARIDLGTDNVTIEDLDSTNGTEVIRGEERIELTSEQRFELATGDVLALGGGAGADATLMLVSIGDESEPGHVVQVKPIAEMAGTTAVPERDTDVLKTLSEVQKRVGAAGGLDNVLVAVAEAALRLVPRATHVTMVLRDDSEESADAGYVPVLTRVRSADGASVAPEGRVPVTRSVFRKVVRERAAVLAADAPSETFSSESLLGTGIRSTIGVPLWLGDDIIGVLQVDNRDAPAMFAGADVDALSVLAENASLAVANARLIRKLVAAEQQLRKENTYLKSRDERAHAGSGEIIGGSRAMKTLFSQLEKVVDTRVTVLIEGKTGTGKELIASAVHYRSKRKDKLFVAQNCAALPETLLESELFGHKKGSFTGATEEKKGLFEVADGGTLFLDEVTEMPLSLQAKLLRVLQEGEVRPIGAPTPKVIDVRIVAATNRELEKEVAEGRFREDLYYRLKVFPIRVPPLKERVDDVPLLAEYFLKKYSAEIGKTLSGFSQEAMELLMSYNWPGNVRELENEVQRIVIQADDEELASPELLSPRVRRVESIVSKAAVKKGTLRQMMDQVEKYFLVESLREHKNNKTSAAKTLGITREGLHKKLRQLKIS